MKKSIIYYSLLLLLPVFAFSQTTVTTNTSAIALAQTIVGSGVTVTSASFSACGGIAPTGSVIAAGTFTNTSGDLGIANGIVLTTGYATDAGKPQTYFASKQLLYNYTDPDLVTISPSATYDVCSLTFTFTPVCSVLNITFVFGSEELPKYICGTYNDAFGIFLNGPNPSGGNYVAQNIAVLPNAYHTPVEIDSINNNYNNLCGHPCQNVSYFVDNTVQSYTDVVYDGFTVPVTSTTSVTPCSTYVMEIAIGESGNGKYDSGVFIQGASVDCGAPPVITASATSDNCAQNNGTATAIVTGFSGTPTYSWTPGGQTTSTITGLSTGSYSCLVGLPGCATTTYTTVVATVSAGGSYPTLSISGNQTICPGATTTLTISGAGAGATYTWNPSGATTNTLSVVGSNSGTTTVTNTLSVVGTTTLGCSTTNIYTVTVNPLPTVTVNSSTICPAASATLTAGGATTFTWSTTQTGNTITVSPASNTSYTVVGTDANGCVNDAVASVIVASSLSVTATPSSASICSGISTTLTGSGASTYSWSPSNSLSSSTGFTVTATPTVTTTYTVTGSSGSCNSTNVVTVNVNNLPAVSGTATQSVICSGGSVTLTGNGAQTYTWTGGVTNGVSFNPISTQTYTVTGTDGNGCTNTSTVLVTVNNLTVTAVPTTTVICNGSSTTLTGNGATNYTWSPAGSLNSSTGTTVTASPTVATTYTVVGSSAGCASTNTVTLNVNNLPAVGGTATQSVICSGGNVTLNGSGAQTYTWSGGVTNGVVFNPTSTQTYTVTGTDINGCKNISTVTVTVNALPVINVNSPSICLGQQTATLTANGANTYTWSTTQTGNSISVNPTANTSYTVAGTDANGCTNISMAVVTVNPLPIITTNTAATCPGVNATLTASGGVSYLWSTSQSGVSISVPGTANSYTVVGTDANGCTNSAVTNVFLLPLPSVQAIGGDTIICQGSSTTLSVTPGNYTYSWSGPNGAIGNSSSVSVNQAGVYTLTATNACGSATSTFTITVSNPNAVFTPSTYIGQVPTSVTFTNTSTGTSLQNHWNFANGDSSHQVNPTETFSVAGTYDVVLTVIDSYGCKDTAIRVIIVTDVPTVVIIPNIFSPNGDNINDIFMITGVGVNNFNCKIYDRWGLFIYEWSNINGGWDGKNISNGKEVTDGTYYFIVNYTDNKQNTVSKQGYLQLVR